MIVAIHSKNAVRKPCLVTIDGLIYELMTKCAKSAYLAVKLLSRPKNGAFRRLFKA